MPAEGGEARRLTVVSPDGPDDIGLVLEPNARPAARAFQAALVEDGIPLTAFAVDDVQKEYERVKGLGVVFRVEPTRMGPEAVAMFEDACGNLIQLCQV